MLDKDISFRESAPPPLQSRAGEMTSPPPRLSLKGSEEDGHHESVAVFVSKLWDMLGKAEYKHLIAWSKVSRTICTQFKSKV